MNLEEIMKPYFDKQEEIEKQYVERKNTLKLRLDNLRSNKEREINEYVQNAVSERPDFYAGYGSMIRKDLEQEYVKKEQELEEQIRNYDKYYRIDVRELVSIKENIRKELISARKELELQISEVQLTMDTIALKLTRFEPIYDDNYNVINGEERANLFAENHRLIEVKYNLEKELESIKEYLNITEITKEEARILMMTLTPWEQEEVNRRNAAKVELEKSEIKIPETGEDTLEEGVKLNESAKTKVREFLTEVLDFKEDPKLERELQELIKEHPELGEKINKLIEGNSTTEEISDLINEYPKLGEILGDYFSKLEVKTDKKELKSKVRKLLTEIFDWKENPELEKEIQELIKQNPELEEKINKLIEGNSTTEEISDLINEYPKLGEILGDYFSKLEVKPEYKEEIPEVKTSEEVSKTDEVIDLEIPEMKPNVENSEEPEIVTNEEKFDDNVTLVNSFESLMDQIYGDILRAAKKTRTVALHGKEDRFLTTLDENDESYQYGGEIEEDNAMLPNGNYINKKDIFKALDKYRKQNKGRVFKIKGYSETFEINRKNIRLLKKHLRDCSAIKLVREKKLGHFDLKRVYGKAGADKYVEMARNVETSMSTGTYINETELVLNIANLFKEKAPSWFEKFKNKLDRKTDVKKIETKEYEEDSLDLDDDYKIKSR